MYGSGTHRELHRGIVTSNDDPERRGRIKVRCDTIAGLNTELPDFIEPAFPFLVGDGAVTTGGWFFVPDVGSVVEIEVATTSPRDETIAMISFEAPSYKWRACVIVNGHDSVSEEFLENYGRRRGMTTTAGHALVFDDTPDDTEVKLQQQHAPGEYSFLDFDAAGSAILMTSAGMMLYMNQEDGQLSLADTNQNLLSMNSDGWYFTSSDSDLISGGGGSISVMTGNMLIAASGVTINLASLDSAVIVEGVAVPFTTGLGLALTELSAALTLLGLPTTNTNALIAALNAGAHTAVRLSTE